MDQFKIYGRIGQGAHGYVMKGVNKYTSEEVALKKLLIKSLDEGIPKNVMREITTLKVLNHEHIVELIEVIPHGMGLIVVMEFLPTNLHEVMKHFSSEIDESKSKTYLRMLLEGVKFMHDNSIMHRDLKPANLLISEEGSLKIADFGLARVFAENEPDRQYSHQVATRWYRAPELLYGSRKYTNTVDMWAIGCIAAELINKAPLFPGETDIEQLAIVLHTLGTPSEETWPGLYELPDFNKITFARSPGLSWQTIMPNSGVECINFIKSLIMYDHRKRSSAKVALNHQYFSEKPEPSPLSNMPKPKNIPTPTIDLDNFQEIVSEFDMLLNDF